MALHAVDLMLQIQTLGHCGDLPHKELFCPLCRSASVAPTSAHQAHNVAPTRAAAGPASAAQQAPPYGYATCPVCGQHIKKTSINTHVESCLMAQEPAGGNRAQAPQVSRLLGCLSSQASYYWNLFAAAVWLQPHQFIVVSRAAGHMYASAAVVKCNTVCGRTQCKQPQHLPTAVPGRRGQPPLQAVAGAARARSGSARKAL